MAVGEAMPGAVDGPRHHDGWGHGTQKCQGEGEVRLLDGQGPGDHKSRQEGDNEEDRDDPNELMAVVASRVIHLDPPCLTAIFGAISGSWMRSNVTRAAPAKRGSPRGSDCRLGGSPALS